MSMRLSVPWPGQARAVLAGALLLVLVGAWWPRPLDDSYISAAYAYELAETGELRWSGGDLLEGYSNFLWVLLQALVVPLGWDLALAAKSAALICGLALVVLASLTAPQDRRGHLLLLALVSWAPLSCWSAMAMETMLATFLAGSGWLAVLRGRLALGLWLLALLALTRPEGSLWLLAGVAACAWGPGGDPRRAWIGMAPLLLVAGYHAWRLSTFGDLFPAPVYLKARGGVFGIFQLVVELASSLGILAALLAGFSLARRELPWVFAPLALSAAMLLGMNGDWMGPARILMPGVVASALAWAALGRPPAHRHPTWIIALAILLCFPWETRFLQPPTLRPLLPRWTEGLETPLHETVEWIVENAPEDALVQSADIGIQGHIPSIRLTDARGLTTRLFLDARRSGDWSEVEALYRDRRARPDVIVVLRMLPSFFLDAGVLELEPLEGLDPWLESFDDVLAHYPLHEDVHLEDAGFRGVARFHRLRGDRPPVELRRARWRALARRFPSHPWLRDRLAAAETQALGP